MVCDGFEEAGNDAPGLQMALWTLPTIASQFELADGVQRQVVGAVSGELLDPGGGDHRPVVGGQPPVGEIDLQAALAAGFGEPLPEPECRGKFG